jgi:predicted secreted protein
MVYDSTQSKYIKLGMATNCTINLTANTEESSTKSDLDRLSKPEVVSKSWTVQVESIDVSDVNAMYQKLRYGTPFTLVWDETSPSGGGYAMGAAFARKGDALLTDATFTFNDRENSTKNLTFTGQGPLEKLESAVTAVSADVDSYTKGQSVRLFIYPTASGAEHKVIAAAKALQIHYSVQLENNSTKDTEGDWLVQEMTGYSYDITSQALVRSNDTITSQVNAHDLASIEDLYEAGQPVRWNISNVSGDNNRTAEGSSILSGKAVITSLSIQASNKAVATYSTQLQGYSTQD